MSGHQRSKRKFPKNSQDLHLGSPEVKKQSFSRIPKIVIWGHLMSESKISQEFPRSLSGVTRGQMVKYPKNSQDHHLGVTRGQKANFPQIPKIGKKSLSLWAFWYRSKNGEIWVFECKFYWCDSNVKIKTVWNYHWSDSDGWTRWCDVMWILSRFKEKVSTFVYKI